MKVGYIRVSTPDQNPDRQLEDMQLDKRFVEYASGKNTERPLFKQMLEFVREGDTVFVHSMDRMARNLHDLKSTVSYLVNKGVNVNFVKENILFSREDRPMEQFLLNVLGSVAEFELALIRERTMEGIRLAVAAGKYKGRKPLNEETIEEINKLVKLGISKRRVARQLGICLVSVYKYLKPESAYEETNSRSSSYQR